MIRACFGSLIGCGLLLLSAGCSNVNPEFMGQSSVEDTLPGRSAPPGFTISAGSGVAESANYKIQGQVKIKGQSTATSTNYEARSGVVR